MSPQCDRPLVVLDVETTGLNPRAGDRLIEVAALKVVRLEPVARFESLINPGCPVSPGAYRVNRISGDMLRWAPKAGEVLPDLLTFLRGACLVGHNIAFDLGFIRQELALLGQSFPEDYPVVDTCKLARALLPELPSYSLGTVAYELGLETAQEHRSMSDVEMTFAVFKILWDAAQRRDVADLDIFSQVCGLKTFHAGAAVERHGQLIAEALRTGGRLNLVYAGRQHGGLHFRVVTPRRVTGSGRQATLVGHCHLRGEERQFKLDRIVRLELDR